MKFLLSVAILATAAFATSPTRPPSPLPEYCVTYFDGCKTCTVEGCDNAKCEQQGVPACRKWLIPSTCTSFFDGCNTCSRGADGQPTQCTELACKKMEAAKCLKWQEAASTAEPASTTVCDPDNCQPPPCAAPPRDDCYYVNVSVDACGCQTDCGVLVCPGGDVGDTCTEDSDCTTSLSCSKGTCGTPTACEPLTCKLFCTNGYALGSDGCPVCRCKNTTTCGRTCPDGPLCKPPLGCTFGTPTNDTCGCRQDCGPLICAKCDDVTCRTGQTCVNGVCLGTPCPDINCPLPPHDDCTSIPGRPGADNCPVCPTYECRPRPGDKCETNAASASCGNYLTCEDGICTAPATCGNSTCSATQNCNLDIPMCVSKDCAPTCPMPSCQGPPNFESCLLVPSPPTDCGCPTCPTFVCPNDECPAKGCGDTMVCVDGKCKTPSPTPPTGCTATSCAPGTSCVNGACVAYCDQGNDCKDTEVCLNLLDAVTCSNEPCKHYRCKDRCSVVKCRPGTVCSNGTCVDSCNSIKCQSYEFCQDGTCKDMCLTMRCPAGHTCSQGECIRDDPCANVACDRGLECRVTSNDCSANASDCSAFECVEPCLPCPVFRCLAPPADNCRVIPSEPDSCNCTACPTYDCPASPCANNTCSASETCLPMPVQCVKAPCPQFQCVAKDACDTIDCARGNICLKGKCVDACATMLCAPGQDCHSGVCQPKSDACELINCGTGTVCKAGKCISLGSDGDKCSSDFPCKAGLSCVEQSCRDLQTTCLDEPCSSDEYCQAIPFAACVRSPCKPYTCHLCPQLRCMACPFGSVPDANGCDTCTCLPAPSTTAEPHFCEPLTCRLDCDYGMKQDAYNCSICECNPKPKCDELSCDLACDNGFVKGEDGCDVCRCQPKCSELNCGDVACEHGSFLDDKDCPTCRCKPAPSTTDVSSTKETPTTTLEPTCDLACDLLCDNGLAIGEDGCPVCRCKPAPSTASTKQPSTTTPKCKEVDCDLACDNGFVKGEDGCDTCQCNKCSDNMCALFCINGFEMGKDGCPLCECRKAGSDGKCSQASDCFESLMCQDGVCTCPMLGCDPLPGCSYGDATLNRYGCQVDCGPVKCQPRDKGEYCFANAPCGQGLICVDDVCKEEPTAPEPKDIWLLGSLELEGIAINEFDIPDFEREAKKALEQAAGQSVKTFAVTGVSTLTSRRRADKLKVDYRAVVDGSNDGVANAVQTALQSTTFTQLLTDSTPATGVTSRSVSSQKGSELESSSDDKNGTTAVIVGCVCTAVVLIAIVAVVAIRSRGRSGEAPPVYREEEGKSAGPSMFTNPTYVANAAPEYSEANAAEDSIYTNAQPQEGHYNVFHFAEAEA
eukprot:m.262848 g.262848  ORF g.262848 m.262848 type:complete len:1349 (-) comp17610_c0_seq3:1586-5632(-)